MAVIGRYDVGDEVIFRAVFRDAAKVLKNPSSLTFSVRHPGGAVESFAHPNPTITNPSTGIWELRYLIASDEPGTWWLRASGVGALYSAGEVAFEVRTSAF